MTGQRTSNWWTLWAGSHPGLGAVPAAVDAVTVLQGPQHVPQRRHRRSSPAAGCGPTTETVFSDTLFTAALRNSIGIALIATLLSVDRRHVRRLRHRPAGVPGQEAPAVDGPGHRHVPAGRAGRTAVQHVAQPGHLRHVDRPDHPVPDASRCRCPSGRCRRSSARSPGRWSRPPRSTAPPRGRRSARSSCPLAAPGVFTTAILTFFFCWNEFLLAISLTSTDRARTVPAALSFFTGASQFQSPVHRHHGRLGRRHHPRRHHRAGLPAAHRRRPDRRCREGLTHRAAARRSSPWQRSP